jgi:hypothetical protein
MRIDQPPELCAVLNPALLHPRTFAGAKSWHNRSLLENGWPSRSRFTFLRRVSGLILSRVKLSDGTVAFAQLLVIRIHF